MRAARRERRLPPAADIVYNSSCLKLFEEPQLISFNGFIMRLIAAVLSASIAFAVNAATVPSPPAPNIGGTWQGTLHDPGGASRVIYQISENSGIWKAKVYVYSLGQSPDPTFATVLLTGSTLRLQDASTGAIYEGTLSADGSSINGKWTDGSRPPLPLDLQRATQATAWPLYETAHKAQFVSVDRGVKLEVLDWGGSGRPVVLLAGFGNSVRIFDRFAPKLTAWYHVYGITRRGFGGSSAPSSGYSADRLGKDVLAVIDALKIDRPVLIGHSLAGEELSYIGSQYQQKIAGVVYLDAGYGYAFYGGGEAQFDLYIDAEDLQRKLTQILFGSDPRTHIALIGQLLGTGLPQVRKELEAHRRDLEAGAPDFAQVASAPIGRAVLEGMEKFAKVNTPILAIYADPHSPTPIPKGTSKAAAEAKDKLSVEAQIATLKRYNPSASIVRLPYADHYVFESNEAEVLKDVHAFINALPTAAPLPSPE